MEGTAPLDRAGFETLRARAEAALTAAAAMAATSPERALAGEAMQVGWGGGRVLASAWPGLDDPLCHDKHVRGMSPNAVCLLQVVREWEFPVQRIQTPPPSPFWQMLSGLTA